MQYPISASVIFVQMADNDEVSAYVAYGPAGNLQKTVRVELKLGTLSDATDVLMWMQMAAASLCDGL